MKKCIPMNKSNMVMVMDYNHDLIQRLNGYAMVVYVRNTGDIEKVKNSIHQPSKIHCIVYEDPYRTLSSILISPNWKEVPIHLYLSGIGDFCVFSEMIPLLKELDIRIFFNADKTSAIVDAQILSSLGIHTGIKMFKKQAHWDEINDLLHYSIYGKVNHTPIEPFDFLCRNYNEESYHCIESVYFNDSERFFHINHQENIFLSREDMLAGENEISTGISTLEKIPETQAYKEYQNRWQSHFLKEHGCAYCPAWRICKAYFEESNSKEKCTEVISDLLEAIEFYKMNNQKMINKKQCLP